MRPAVPVLLAVLISLTGPVHTETPRDEASGRLTGLGPDGVVWSLPLDGTGDPPAAGTPLEARRWHPTFLDIEIPLLEGGAFSLAGARGRVLVLEFWATWCAPCWDTLPALQALHDTEHERGLEIVAINARENPHVALAAADEMGLTLPIGEYSDELEQLFEVEILPTLIIADRMGRVRSRWSRYEPGVVEEVIALARELIEDEEGRDPDPPVARVSAGDGLFEVQWMRRTPARPHGLVLAPVGDGERGILAAHGGSLALYARDGRVVRDWKVPGDVGSLRRGPVDAEGRFPVVGFRPGGRRLVLMHLPEGRVESVEAPSPVFDAAPVRSEGASWEIVAGTGDSLVVGTVEGLRKPLDDSRLVSSLARFAPGTEAAWVALSVGGEGPSRLTWLDRSLAELDTLDGPADAWSLIVDPSRPDRVVAAPAQVTAAAVGRFTSGGSPEAAFATRSGRLVVLDLETGKERFRADWSDGFIAHLAAGDLDGDGLDELVAAAGQHLLLLTSPARRAALHK